MVGIKAATAAAGSASNVHGAAQPVSRAPIPRRRVITLLPPLLGLAVGAEQVAPAAAHAADAIGPALATAAPRPDSLAARIATTGSIRQPGLMPPWAPKQIYFPRWLFGEWQVEMQFTGLSLPLGRDYVPDGFLQAAEAPAEEGGLGSRYSFAQRWYSTLPPTLDNQLRVNLGLGMPRDAIIADRAFNTRQSTNAFLGWSAVESVEYDPSEAPLRETVTLSRVAPDASPLPPRRLELYLNRLASEEEVDEQGGTTFYASELCRQVLLGVRQAEVKDYELIRSWQEVRPGVVTGRQRSCLYLQPQERLYFGAAGRAVAVYDYSFTMARVPPEADAPRGAVACVPTPKDVVQCL